MAVRMVFRCDHCGSEPDALTQRTLLGELRDRTVGTYRNAQPGGWLIWTAGGPLGCKRYACPEHRDELVAYLRRHYGATSSAVRAAEPYADVWPDGLIGFDEQGLAALLAGDPRDSGVAEPR